MRLVNGIQPPNPTSLRPSQLATGHGTRVQDVTSAVEKTAGPTIIDVIRDWYPEFLADSWRAWRVFLSVVFGLPVPESDEAVIGRCTGREPQLVGLPREVWLIIGRRGGKSRITALLATFIACFKRYLLALGERGVVMVIAADRRQARIVKRYVAALLHAVPMLAALIVNETKESIDLSTGITIEIHTASYRTTRGYTVVAVIADEIAFWPTDDAANPDTEILNALRPGMATVPGALLIALSSPYARRGELWRAYRDHFGKDADPVLVWQADTRTMNPTVSQDVVEQAYADDDAAASAEYGAQFRRDVESLHWPRGTRCGRCPGPLRTRGTPRRAVRRLRGSERRLRRQYDFGDRAPGVARAHRG